MKELVLKYRNYRYRLEDIVVFLLLGIFLVSWTSPLSKKMFGMAIVGLSVLLCIILYSRLKKTKKNIALLAFIVILNTLFLFLDHHGIGNYAFVIYLVLLLFTIKKSNFNVKLGRKMEKYLLIYNLIYCIFLKSSLNANMQAMVVLGTYVIGTSYVMNKIKDGKFVFLYLLVLIATFFIDYNYLQHLDSRSAILAFSFFNITLILPKKLLTRKSLLNIAVILSILGSFLFMAYYISSWKNNADINIAFSDKQFFSGRELIWSYTFDELDGNLIAGIGSSYGLYDGVIGLDDSHNSMLQLLKSNGIIVFIAIIVLLINAFRYVIKYGNINEKLCIYSFLSLMIFNCTESFFCDFGSNFLILFPLYLSISSINERKREDEV